MRDNHMNNCAMILAGIFASIFVAGGVAVGNLEIQPAAILVAAILLAVAFALRTD